MLENLRRKSLTKISKIYCEPIRQVAFYSGYARYENQSSIEQYKQRFSKEKITNLFPKPFIPISKDFRTFHFSLDAINFNMIYCSEGTFTMGGRAWDNQSRKVIIERPFLLGETEITQELYEKVMKRNPSEFKHPRNPVENVSWVDAIIFCNKLSELQGLDKCYTRNPKSLDYGLDCDFTKNGYRLPKEKEWEYAAKAGTQNLYAGTDDKSKLGEYAWFDENSNYSTHPVATKKPNEWGFYDMSGNVMEWCWDTYTSTHSDIYKHRRVLRGGSWDSYNSNYRLKSIFRLECYSPDHYHNDIGFRVCRTVVN